MSDESIEDRTDKPAATPLRPLRIWPAITLVGLMILGRLSAVVMDSGPAMMWAVPAFAPALMAIGILVWWLTFSRAAARERIFGFLGIVAACVVASMLTHSSLHGPPIVMIVFPLGVLFFAATAIAFAKTKSTRRTWLSLAAACVGFAATDLIRTDGVGGVSYQYEVSPRWKASAEELYLQELAEEDSKRAETELTSEGTAAVLADPEWPCFRGKGQDGRVDGVTLSADWKTKANRPRIIWKRRVGPSWSSFVVAGEFLFTQEQRGKFETVVCMHIETGQEVWTQQAETRFYESMAGPGPRATPTLADGALFSFGANGLLQRLDRLTGEVVWQRELATEDDLKTPMWGFSSSPLVVDGQVIVSAVEPGKRGVLAFNIADGKPAWTASTVGMSYSSPQLVEIGEKRFAAVVSGTGVTFYSVPSGSVALDYKWEIMGYRTVQPMMVEGGMVIGSTRGAGSRRISLSSNGDELAAEVRWTSLQMKPDFNDFVVHDGAIYGFDQSIFTCLDLETGKRRWKGGRYGKGQVLLLPQSDQLLVLSEKGNLVLMSARTDKHVELASFPVIEGKTWNHPIMIGNRVYVRNGREAACVELPVVSKFDAEKIVLAN